MITVLSLFGIGINSQVLGQTIEEQKEQIEKLQNENKIEEERTKLEENKKARIEAQRAAAEALLPDIDSSNAPLGTISADDKVTFENTVLAYQSMNRIMEVVTEEIKTEILDKVGSKVSLIVFDGKAVPFAFAKLDYELFKARINSIKKDYQELIPDNIEIPDDDGSSFIDPSATATAGFLFDLLPFFRVNETYKGTSVDVNTKAFVAKLSSKFREADRSNVSVYYPAEYPLVREDAIESILKDISNLQRLNYQAQKTIPNLTPQQLAKLKEVNKSFDQLVGELTNQNTGKSLLEAIASSRSLQSIVDSEQNKVYFISVEILAGGTNRTSQSFLSNRLRHSGGVIVKYIVYDTNASIVLSNVHDYHTGFTKVHNSK
ncbi:MAG: hypothetical protein HC907_00610 [Richelia sp. SM1_7_0]|nr:hypothetical protein [Richelia sp. SM1_7_0]